MTSKRTGKVLTRFLFLLLLGLAASVFGSLAAHAYTGDEPPPAAPVVRLLHAGSAALPDTLASAASLGEGNS